MGERPSQTNNQKGEFYIMKTTTTAIEMVINAGVTAAEEIFYFVMDKKNGVTIPALDAGLLELGITFKKKDAKENKANLFARALEMNIMTGVYLTAMDETSVAVQQNEGVVDVKKGQVAGESVVAEVNTKTEEMVEMVKANNKVVAGVITAEQKVSNLVALSKSKVTKGDAIDMLQGVQGYENPNLRDMLDKVEAAKNKYIKNVGENAVKVVGIEFFDTPNKTPWGAVNLGKVTIQLPRDYAQIKVWDDAAKKFEWMDFADFNMDATRKRNPFRVPAEGSGFLVLNIREGADGKPVVRMPVDADKNVQGKFYDVFRTSDVRFAKTKDAARVDEPLFISDNNENLNAAVTAFVQVFTGEFEQENPFNRNGFNESCLTCRNVVMLSTKDGVTDDMDMVSKKSRAVLEQPDVMQLAQVGSYQPSAMCMISGKFIDIEPVMTLNEATTFERDHYVDEEGNFRFQAQDEVMIAGKPVKVRDVRVNGTKAVSDSCSYYHGNSPKGEAQVAKERTTARENQSNEYVSPYYKTRAKVGRQAIQTLVSNESGKQTWETIFPGQAESPLEFRVKGIGVTVYGSDDIMAVSDPEFVAATEEFDARHAEVMKKVNQIFYAAFNLEKLDAAQSEMVFELADSKPEDLTDAESEKWDKAVFWLAQSLQWAADREEARKIPAFADKFHIGVKEGTIELNIEDDVMSDTLYRTEQGTLGWGLGYDDLNATEFVRYLDEVAIDYVYQVITEGVEFSLVGGSDKDKELAAGALQAMLQRELNTWIWGVRRDADQKELFETGMNVCEEVRAYLAGVVGVSK